MSEYQYYEFIAIDGPLTPKQMAELRACSSHANITPTSFVNDYQWGDLKGDSVDWMRRYFDAHVYVANWCTCVLCLRLPKSAFNASIFRNRCWRTADKCAERGFASAYDEVMCSLVDLSDAYALCATRADFDRRLGKFLARHGKRGALLRRLVEAGLCQKSSQ